MQIIKALQQVILLLIVLTTPEEEQHQILDTNATPEDRKLSFIKDGYTTLHEIITAINNNK